MGIAGMSEEPSDKEALVNLEKAEVIVPLDAISVEQDIPVPTTMSIDPIEFYEFLGNYDDWPSNGLRLAEAAERHGYSTKLTHFFEGIPGSLSTEADVMPYAEDPSKPPFGAALESARPRGNTEDADGLSISDITQAVVDSLPD